jgi:chromosome segregation ATPase
MPEMTLLEAANALGKSTDTIRRRVRLGQLEGRQDERGRLWVTLPDQPQQETLLDVANLQTDLEALRADYDQMLADLETAHTEQGETLTRLAELRHELAAAMAEVEHTRELLTEVTRQRDTLETQLAEASKEKAELRTLMGLQLKALAAPKEQPQAEPSTVTPETSTTPQEQPRPGRKWFWQR